MNHTLASACDICPPRYYCINGDRADPCPAGSYCPGNTGLNLEQCPRGTYSPVTLLAAEAECMPCDGGYYCGETGLTAVTDQCYSGYYCREGVDTPAPDSNNTGDGGIDFCLTHSSLNSPLSPSSTTSRELLSQFSACSG